MMKLLVKIEKIQCANAKLSRRTGMKIRDSTVWRRHPPTNRYKCIFSNTMEENCHDGGEGEREAEDVNMGLWIFIKWDQEPYQLYL